MFLNMCRNISIGVAIGWTVEVRFPTGISYCSLLIVQTGSGAHTASYPWYLELFHGV
jgi:hypothetical protein